MKIETFYTLANKVHGSYKYGDFKGMMIPMVMICPEHGEFARTPNAHINHGKGCPLCETLNEIDDTEKVVYVMETKAFDDIFNKE